MSVIKKLKDVLKKTLWGMWVISAFLGAQGRELDDFSLDALEEFESYRQVPDDYLLQLQKTAQFLNNVVKKPLWKSTKAPEGRNILYLLPHKISAIEYGGISLNLFYNMTDRMKVTADQLIPDRAINLEALNAAITLMLKKASLTEVSRLIPLFKKVTIQERRLGTLVQSGFIKGPYSIQLHTSLQVAERNFWLNKKDQEQIKKLIEKDFGAGSGFDEREAYKIRTGLGDTRLKIGFNSINMTNFQADLGIETIIPTSRFSYSSSAIPSLEKTLDPEQVQDSLLGVLRGARDYMLNPQLGNNGHFGVGCFFESKIGMFHDLVQVWMRASYDKLFSGHETRLLMHKQTMDAGSIDEEEDDSGVLQKQVQQYAREYLFPTPFKCKVYPGGVFNFVLATSFIYNKKWRFTWGYDFYAQQREYIKAIYNAVVDLNELRVSDAESLRTSQHKFFSETLYLKQLKNVDLAFGYGGDVTLASKGLGFDWTVFLKVAASF